MVTRLWTRSGRLPFSRVGLCPGDLPVGGSLLPKPDPEDNPFWDTVDGKEIDTHALPGRGKVEMKGFKRRIKERR